MLIAQILIIALILLVIIGGAYMFMQNQEAEKKRRAMAVVTGQSDFVASKKTSVKDEQDKRRAEIARKLKDRKGEEGKGDKDKRTMSLVLEQAGAKITVTQFWMLSAVSMIVFVLGGKVFGMSPFVLIMLAVIGLFGFPRYIIKRMTNKRQKAFLTEFPDALEASVRLLKAGMPVAEAIAMVSKEFDGPVGEEMTRIYDQQKIGVPLHEAAYASTRRMPLTEMQMFATGLAIQAQTGSSLSEVLMNLSNVIRQRFRLKRKVKALSSEAVASAGIIGAMPVLVCVGLYFGNPEYIAILFTHPTGKMLLGGAIMWMCIGVVVMKMMINFKI